MKRETKLKRWAIGSVLNGHNGGASKSLIEVWGKQFGLKRIAFRYSAYVGHHAVVAFGSKSQAVKLSKELGLGKYVEEF